MRTLTERLNRFRREEAGLTNSEYAVILSLIIAVIITALPPLAGHMSSAFAGVEFGPETQTQLLTAKAPAAGAKLVDHGILGH